MLSSLMNHQFDECYKVFVYITFNKKKCEYFVERNVSIWSSKFSIKFQVSSGSDIYIKDYSTINETYDDMTFTTISLKNVLKRFLYSSFYDWI